MSSFVTFAVAFLSPFLWFLGTDCIGLLLVFPWLVCIEGAKLRIWVWNF
jgi:hypothetical protein